MDLGEAAEQGVTVAEITGSNTVSVAEHAGHADPCARPKLHTGLQRRHGGGRMELGEIASSSHDLEGKTVGIYGAGQIGQLIAARLKPST